MNMIDPREPISTLKGVGPKKQTILNDFGIHTVEDFLYLFPRKYQDRRNVTKIKDVSFGEHALVTARVLVKKTPNFYRKNSPLSLMVEDETGTMEVVFFNGRFLSNLFNQGMEYSFYGKVTENFGRPQMIHPEFSKSGGKDDIRGIIPVYPNIQGFSQKEIRRIQGELRESYPALEEWLPKKTMEEYRLADLIFSMSNLHFPTEGRNVLAAKYRMVFSEFLIMETGLMAMKRGEGGVKEAISFSCEWGDRFASNLAFDLTSGQRDAWERIKSDLEGSHRMNRLLQGDVGSGKTVVAEMAMLSCAKSGYQSVIMAPTEVLAKQHLETFGRDMAPYGIEPKLLISSMDPKEKRKTIEGLASGEHEMLIATHAVLQDNIKFKNLGLVITDEQHRFGVNQRKKLSDKGEGANVLVMTATPIPRTLAVILYGDMDTSQIRTMPEGRKPVQTIALGKEDRASAYNFARNQLREGRQIYVVAPLIEDSESIDALSATGLYNELKETFGGYKVALVHGAMKQDEKDEIMEAFSKGDIHVLVSTVVIEVGINVPNATVMIIENSERFGLAQLHQLRGRVGRGSHESYCYLLSDNDSEIALKRREIMCKTNDGFEIAEEDMALRGPGEIFGVRQHGAMQPMLSDMVKHIDVLENAQNAAKDILDVDPRLEMPENQKLKDRVTKMFGEELDLLL